MGAHQKRGKKPDLPISDVVSRLESFAPEMAKYIEQVKRHKPHSWGYHLRRLLALKINYRIDDIMVAVRRATAEQCAVIHCSFSPWVSNTP